MNVDRQTMTDQNYPRQFRLMITGLRRDSAQGDRFMVDILERMGARVLWDKDEVTVFPSALHGVDVNMNACPDIVPTVAAVAAFARGETVISGAAHLAIKECDRIGL